MGVTGDESSIGNAPYPITSACFHAALRPKALSKPAVGPAGNAALLYEGAMDWILSKRVTDQQGKDKTYWINEIAFLEARLNGSQGDIDNEDRAACEEALKAAKANLAASR